MGLCKGALLVHLRSFVSETKGPAAWDALVRGTRADDREVLSSVLLVSGWYPIGVYNRVLSAFTAQQDDPDKSMLDYARHIANRDLNTVMKIALSFASPAAIVKRSPVFWTRYFGSGKCTAREEEPGQWCITTIGPKEIDGGPGEHTCRVGIGGWLTEGVTLAGAKNTKFVHRACRFRGDPFCETLVSWR